MKSLSDCRVLLVDDTKTNLDILVEGLKSDHKLSLALNGDIALQIAARNPPDLVLLDIMMPGIDGYEVCRRLRERPETAEVPIMFLSSLEEVQNKTRGFEVGGNDYLTKPFDMLEVKARVRSLLKAKAYSDAVKEQIASELRIAREIQMGMVPQDFTEVEQAYRVSFGAVLEPAREVGGDLYGVCAAGSDRLMIFVGDVSGKGIPASMFMVRAVSLARLLSRDIVEPERILARLNNELSAENSSCMFVTFLCAVYEPTTRRLTLANGGHCKPLLLPVGGPPRWILKGLGTALGFEPDIPYSAMSITLNEGDTVVFYTDGVTEAFNPESELYGNDQLLADAALFAGQSVDAITTGLLAKVRAFAGSTPQSDDIAILTFRVESPGYPVSAGVGRRLLELHATPGEVMRAVETLQEFARSKGVPENLVFGLALALEECGSNIVNHAFQGDANKQFQVVLEYAGGVIAIELRDRGPEFDPTLKPERKSVADDDDRPGGWGIALVRRHTDEITYLRDEGENVLRLAKRLDLL